MKILTCILILSFGHCVYGQITFENRYTGMDGSDAKAIRQTPDSGYIVVGGESQPLTKMTVMRLNQQGDTLWWNTYDNPSTFGFNVDVTSDSGYIVTGYAFDPTSKAFLLKLDSVGNTEWFQTYSDSVSEWGQAVRQLGDGGYLVAGRRIFRTDENGDVLWTKPTGSGNQAMSMIPTSDGHFVYTQTSSSINSGTWLTKMDDDGNAIWTESFSDLYTHNNCDNNVAETSDGGYILSGQSTGSVEGILMKIDADREVEWAEEFQPGSLGAATSVIEADSGGFLTCGYKVDGTGVNAYLHRTDADGNLLWDKIYPQCQGQSLIPTFDGGYAFTGYKENNSGKQKYFVAKIGGPIIDTGLFVPRVNSIPIKVFPTITNAQLNVQCTDCYGAQAQIIDLKGRLVDEVPLQRQIAVGHLQNGAYFLVSDKFDTSLYFQVVD